MNISHEIQFKTLESALKRLPVQSSCTSAVLSITLDIPIFDLLEHPEANTIFDEFFNESRLICTTDTLSYFPSKSALIEVHNQNLNWKNFLNRFSEFLLKFNKNISLNEARSIAADVQTFYEWFVDIDYLSGSEPNRRSWLTESPLNI